MESFCTMCGTPGCELCWSCQEEFDAMAVEEQEAELAVPQGAAQIVNDLCDCRVPAPTTKVINTTYYECAGCRGAVSMMRAAYHNTRLRSQ